MSQIDFLVVDDDEVFSNTLAKLLAKRNFTAIVANNSTDALQQLDQQYFHYVILDLKIASESGLHLLPQLLNKQPKLEVLILTGYSSITTAVEAIKMGAVNYLCKPASLADIFSALKISATPDSEIPTSPPNTLPENLPDPDASAPSGVPEINQTPHSVERLEWEHIQRILAKNDGNISETARQLGMHRRTLQRKLHKKPVKK